jgi:hypothetical protein
VPASSVLAASSGGTCGANGTDGSNEPATGQALLDYIAQTDKETSAA